MRADRLSPEILNYRACTPDETFAKVSSHLSRLGITRVASQTGLDRIGIPVWCAYTPNARAIVIAQGKGLDDSAARTSAVMEAVERAVATQPACDSTTLTLADLLAKGQSVHTLNSLLSSGSAPIAPDEHLSWTKAKNLVDGGDLWVPFDAICFDRTVVAPRFWLSSDGLASGNTWEEAVLHGLLERVERDALTLWTVTAPTRRFNDRIDPGSLRHDALQAMLRRIDIAGLEIALFDTTTDLGIPCISALLAPRDRDARALRHVDVTLGAGASLSPTIAASRAISEAVQSRMTFIAGARDDLLPDVFSRPADRAIISAFKATAARSLDELPVLPAESTGIALTSLIRHLAGQGIRELYAVDITPDWLPVHVAKVLAPQLENPDGNRRHRFGNRALSRSLQ